MLGTAELAAIPKDLGAHENHIVQFYESEDFLCDTVATFLATGLAAGEPVVVVATEAHRHLFCERLAANGFDVERELASGRFTMLDARETLATFMVDGLPDWQRFKMVVGDTIEKSGGGRPVRVRAYGEMVDLLWREGNPRAAVLLEELWNDIAKLHSFSLLCAYVLGNFYKESDGEGFHHVCRAHTHVLPAESFPRHDSEDARLREISILQQRARALESEIEHRKGLERGLREALRDRVRAEDALRDFVENAVYGLHWVGPDGVVQWANKAEFGLLGYTRDEYIGRHISEFHADREVIDDILERLGRDETLQDFEARLRCKDGSIRHVLISSNVYREDGEFVHTRYFTRDVTAKKLADEERLRSERLLAAALEREKAAREEAERTVRFNEMFAGILGHDLRNPLSAIATGARYLARMNEGERVTKTASRLLSSTDRMSRMIDQLLDFTRIRVGGGLTLRGEWTDLGDLCHRVKEELEAAHPDRTVVLEVAKDTGGVWDDDRLLQVFSNLVGNALAHGGSDRPVSVRVDGSDPSMVTVRVHNAGAIPDDLLPVMFEPFRGGSKQYRTKGLGLGLYITRQVLLAHQGTIDVESSEASGTTFVVMLPRSG